MRCNVDDNECVPGRLKRGMCELHYRRVRLTGTTASRRVDNLTRYEVNEDGCWIWQGPLWANGYGKPSKHIHGTRLAHRAFYLEHVGPVPEGYDVDHRCHNEDPMCVRGSECPHRACVNPAHLQAVTHRENLIRGMAAQRMCEAGLHDLTIPDAVMKGTIASCVECWRRRYRAGYKTYAAKRRAAAAATD